MDLKINNFAKGSGRDTLAKLFKNGKIHNISREATNSINRGMEEFFEEFKPILDYKSAKSEAILRKIDYMS